MAESMQELDEQIRRLQARREEAVMAQRNQVLEPIREAARTVAEGKRANETKVELVKEALRRMPDSGLSRKEIADAADIKTQALYQPPYVEKT